MAVKPRVLEEVPEHLQQRDEFTNTTAALPTHRFVTGTGTDGECTIADTAGEAVMGVSMNSPHPAASNRQSDFADYAVDDIALILLDAPSAVYVEASAALVTAGVERGVTRITTDAAGRAAVAATGNTVAGVALELVEYDGTTYCRMLPKWNAREVVA